MIDPKNFLQTGCFQSHRPVGKRLTFTTAKRLTVVLLPAVLLSFAGTPLRAQAQCTAAYEPGTQSQRISDGLFDGRVGPVKVVNNTENATVISLYHPDAPKRVFKYWYAEPGKSYLLGTDNYSSDWGIQMDDGPICIVGRVASWDGATFTTFPSRLFIADAPPIAGTVRSQPAIALTPLPQPPTAYEAIALKQLTEGEVRGGLISLLRAADLYRANGQTKEEQRVRDRIKQIRGS